MADGFEVSVKEEFWRFHLGRQAAGDATIGTYCREHGLAESSFYAWRLKIERRDSVPDRHSRRLPQGGQKARSPGRRHIQTTQSRPTVISCSVPTAATAFCERPRSERIGLVALEIVGDASPQSTMTTANPTLEIACPSGVVIRLREEASAEVLQRVIVACEQSHRVAAESATEVCEVRSC